MCLKKLDRLPDALLRCQEQRERERAFDVMFDATVFAFNVDGWTDVM